MQRLFTVFAVFCTLSVYFFGEHVLIFLQGEEYLPAVQALHIMSWAVMFYIAALPAGVSIMASDNMRIFKYFQLYATGFVVIASMFIIKPYGFIGASYTVCILWGILLLCYLGYASYKRFISPVNMFLHYRRV